MTPAMSAWTSSRFGDRLSVRYGKALPKELRDSSGRYPVVGSAGVMTCTELPLVEGPAVVIGRKGNVGEARYFATGCWPIDTTYYVVVPEGIDPEYLTHHLRALDLKRLDSSTATPSLRRQDLEAQSIRFPSLTEQRRIVEILEDHLSRLDAADAGLRTLRARLRSLRATALDGGFGIGTATDTVPMGDLVARISAGKSYGGSSRPAALDEWGIIKVSAMTWGEFDAAENKSVPNQSVDPRFEIKPGDLLVSRANTSEYVGASVLVREVRPRLLLSDKSLRLTPRPGVSAEWLWRALQAPSARRQISAHATGTKDSMRNISQVALTNIALPEVDSDSQRSALRDFDVLEASILRLESSAAGAARRSRAQQRAVLAAAFEGKLTGRHTDDEVIEELAEARSG